MSKPILAVDFEPILYPADPYESQRHKVWPLEKPPVGGAFDFLHEAMDHFEIHVVSWRTSHWEYLRWWKRFHWVVDGKTGRPVFIRLVKSPETDTFLYIGSRVFQWKGDWPSPVELTKFRPAQLEARS